MDKSVAHDITEWTGVHRSRDVQTKDMKMLTNKMVL